MAAVVSSHTLLKNKNKKLIIKKEEYKLIIPFSLEVEKKRKREKTVEKEKMLAKESSRFDLPEELLEVLPLDPFEQLDVARKITSIALSTRVDALESEVSDLRNHLADRDNIIAGMESQLQSLDASLAEASDNLAAALQEKVPPPFNSFFFPFGFVVSVAWSDWIVGKFFFDKNGSKVVEL